MGRAPCCEKVGLKRGRWTAEEDEILTNYIQANGEGSWRSLPKNAGLLRCGKSCRLRWINYLRGDLKRGNISVEEESLIVKLHASFGNRWSLIASHMPGRTDNEIKNYWNSHLSRKVYSFRGTTTKAIVDTPPRRRGGRTSRWAMKKNKAFSINLQNQKGSSGGGETVHQNSETVPLPPTPELVDFLVSDDGGGGGDQRRCDDNENGKESDGGILLGPSCQEGGVINDDEVLSFHEFMDTCLMEPCGTSVDDDEERENAVIMNGDGGNDTCTVEKTSMDRDQLHYSGSCNSLQAHSGLDREEADESVLREQNEDLLTWLWEDEDWEKDFQIFDHHKQNDMLYWFLS